MADLSVSKAFGAGFRVIGQAPLAPLAWGVVAYLAALPVYLVQMQFWPPLMRYLGEMATSGPEAAQAGGAMNDMMAASQAMNLASIVSLPFTLAASAVIFAAVCRAVLEPKDRGFFFLRLGARELWIALAGVVLYVLLMFAIIALMFLLMAMIFFAALLSRLGGVGVIFAVVFSLVFIPAALLIFTWFMTRLAMAGPMTFADRKFRLFEAWSFTSGQGWRLVGLSLLVVLAVCAIQMLMLGAGAAAAIAFGLRNVDQLRDLLARPEDWISAALPFVLLITAVVAAAGGYLNTILMAPYADAYRQIAGPRGLEEVF